MDSTLKRTWASIDLDALAYNCRHLQERMGPGARMLGVVKADAYGHGAVQSARVLEEMGCAYLAVSNIDEARELRLGLLPGGPAGRGGHAGPHQAGYGYVPPGVPVRRGPL